MWLHSVACRALRSTVSRTRSPSRSSPALDRERHRLVVAEPVDVLDARRAGVALHDARVGDLAAALRVEGALRKLRQQHTVGALQRADAASRTSVVS